MASDVTVALAARKYGHVLPPACDRVGEVIVVEIGIPKDVLGSAQPSLGLLEASDAALAFPSRPPGAHKGTFGHVLVIGGSPGKTGAAILAARAALRSGAGLVTVATAAPAQAVVAAGAPEIMTEPLPVGASSELGTEAIERAVALARERDVTVLGPGLGQDRGARGFVREFVRRCQGCLVVDADGLNALAPSGARVESAVATLRRGAATIVTPHPGEMARVATLRRGAATIVTPHPGEMARLVGADVEHVQRRRLETARALAVETGAVVALKGQRTVVVDAAGRAAVNPTGNPGMATGGTGDVLAGITGALLARLDPWTAATAGVYLHGLAGDRAAAIRGQAGLVAGDLIEALPDAIRQVGVAHS